MITLRWISICLLLAALVTGTLSDERHTNPVVTLGGYRMLAADFHIHSFPNSWAMLGPFDTVEEANRQGLNVIAMTPHNLIWVAEVGQWYSRKMGGATVIVGEEIVSPRYHLLAIGIHRTVPWNQSSSKAIDEIHAQGGVAIAAHPVKNYWRGYDADAMNKLDGAEVLHPLAYENASRYKELQEFYGRAKLTAIGDSDYHGLGPMGLCRTYVFARDDSESAILEALRAGRTVVYDRDRRAYGDPQLVALAAQDAQFQELLHSPPDDERDGFLAKLSRVCGIFGLLGFFLTGLGRPRKAAHCSPIR